MAFEFPSTITARKEKKKADKKRKEKEKEKKFRKAVEPVFKKKEGMKSLRLVRFIMNSAKITKNRPEMVWEITEP